MSDAKEAALFSTQIIESTCAWLEIFQRTHTQHVNDATAYTVGKQITPYQFTAQALYTSWLKNGPKMDGIPLNILDQPVHSVVEFFENLGKRPSCDVARIDIARMEDAWKTYKAIVKDGEKEVLGKKTAAELSELLKDITMRNMFMAVRWEEFMKSFHDDGVLEVIWALRKINSLEDAEFHIIQQQNKRARLTQIGSQDQLEKAVEEETKKHNKEYDMALAYRSLSEGFEAYWKDRSALITANYENTRKLEITGPMLQLIDEFSNKLQEALRDMRADQGTLLDPVSFIQQLNSVQRTSLQPLNGILNHPSVDRGTLKLFLHSDEGRPQAIRPLSETINEAQLQIFKQAIHAFNVVNIENKWCTAFSRLYTDFNKRLVQLYPIPHGFDDLFTRLSHMTSEVNEMIVSDALKAEEQIRDISKKPSTNSYGKILAGLRNDAMRIDAVDTAIEVYQAVDAIISDSSKSDEEVLIQAKQYMNQVCNESINLVDFNFHSTNNMWVVNQVNAAVKHLQLDQTSNFDLKLKAGNVVPTVHQLRNLWKAQHDKASTPIHTKPFDGLPKILENVMVGAPSINVLRVSLGLSSTSSSSSPIAVKIAEFQSTLVHLKERNPLSDISLQYERRLDQALSIFGGLPPQSEILLKDVLLKVSSLLDMVRHSETQKLKQIDEYKPRGSQSPTPSP